MSDYSSYSEKPSTTTPTNTATATATVTNSGNSYVNIKGWCVFVPHIIMFEHYLVHNVIKAQYQSKNSTKLSKRSDTHGFHILFKDTMTTINRQTGRVVTQSHHGLSMRSKHMELLGGGACTLPATFYQPPLAPPENQGQLTPTMTRSTNMTTSSIKPPLNPPKPILFTPFIQELE